MAQVGQEKKHCIEHYFEGVEPDDPKKLWRALWPKWGRRRSIVSSIISKGSSRTTQRSCGGLYGPSGAGEEALYRALFRRGRAGRPKEAVAGVMAQVGQEKKHCIEHYFEGVEPDDPKKLWRALW